MQYNLGDVSFNTFLPQTVVFMARPPPSSEVHWKVYGSAIGRSIKGCLSPDVATIGGSNSHLMSLDELPLHMHSIYNPAYGLTNTLAELVETFAKRKSTQSSSISALPASLQEPIDMTPLTMHLIPVQYLG